MLDYYEFLQISPNADTDTIHRVYRFLATRLHPDNPRSGDPELFHLLKTAYDVLSNPESRAEYDASRRREPAQTAAWSKSIDFMDSLEGELNRRLAVLAVLYSRRRTNPGSPEVPLVEIEVRMGFPRDYLDFTTWYLVKKGYVAKADNSAFTLTSEGVDFVESHRASMPILNKMLTSGSESSVAIPAIPGQPPVSARGSIELPVPAARPFDWRRERPNSHAGLETYSSASAMELSVLTLDRRADRLDRRTSPRGRRAGD
jgi:curved DNA-binding protein CbpA